MKVIAVSLAVVSIMSLSLMLGISPASGQSHSYGTPREIPHSGPNETYAIHLMETGLRKGVTWHVNLTIFNGSESSSGPNYTSNTSEISFEVPPGNYSTLIWSEGPYVLITQTGFYVTNESFTITVPFARLYPVSVADSNLPANVSLGMRLVTQDTNASFINSQLSLFPENAPYIPNNATTSYVANGTYTVFAGEVFGPSTELFVNTGNVTVNGKTVNINLASRTGEVNLTARNLPNNVSWGFPGSASVLSPGLKHNITLYLPQGNIHLQPVAKGYYSSGVNVSVKNGTVINASVAFVKEYAIVFIPHGLLSRGQVWKINGLPATFEGTPPYHPFLSGGNSTFLLPNGTYHYSISIQFMPGYYVINGTVYYENMSVDPSSANLTVNGHSLSVNVTFTLSKRFVRPTNAIMDEYWDAGIIIAIACVGAGIYALDRHDKSKK